MCLIALAWRAHPQFELVLAANRDEFHARRAAPAAFWDSDPDIFGGRDLTQGGGWLAVTRSGRFAAVTNVRRMLPPDPAAPSRGALVAGFLRSREAVGRFGERLAAEADHYSGFNLLIGDGERAAYLTNQAAFHYQELAPGLHGVSNAALDTPWPKLLRLRTGVQAWLADGRHDNGRLFEHLADEHPAADADLPDTGVGRELERFLSSPFIRGEHYGTRASSIVTIPATGSIEFRERRFGPNGLPAGETVERFERLDQP
ncbi:MAG TPA: NRDE family protein [Solimonas sp.]|nr:NRDE family protein [Solimonas sp.]